jgi:acetolactate synthase-1/2/3 large subunit
MANGSACVCSFQNAVIKKNQRYILNSGNASMGYGLPASIGACISSNKRNVICLEGDGSIMMNIQELETIKYNKLPIKIFIINNSGYSSIRQTQRNFFNGTMTGSGIDSGVSVPNFIKIGKAFGFKTKRIKSPKNMEKEIKEVLKSKEPVLCEVMVEKEYGFYPKLSAKKLPDGTMISPTLEDMYPFLDREEFNKNIIGSNKQ